MNWLLAFLVVSNVFLWLALTMCMRAISEWMDAMTDAYDEHRHEPPHRVITDNGGYMEATTSPPLSSRSKNL